MAIVKSAGLAIVYNNKLLLGHPTGHRDESLTIPKGKIDKGETKLEAAIRETYEEVGIQVPLELVGPEGDKVEYRKTKRGVKNAGNVYKIVYWFPVLIEDLSQIGLESEEINKDSLELREIDWARFIPADEIEGLIFDRFKPIARELKLI